MLSIAARVANKVNRRCMWHLKGHDYPAYKKIFDEVAKEFNYVRKYKSQDESLWEALHPPVKASSQPTTPEMFVNLDEL